MRFLRTIHSRIYPESPSVSFPYHLLEEKQVLVPKSWSLSSVIMAECPLSSFLVACSKKLSAHFLKHLKHPRMHWLALRMSGCCSKPHPSNGIILGLPLRRFISSITVGVCCMCVCTRAYMLLEASEYWVSFSTSALFFLLNLKYTHTGGRDRGREGGVCTCLCLKD